MEYQVQQEGGETQLSSQEERPVPLFPGGEDRMRLTHEERLFARFIKAVVQDMGPEVEPLSDFMYAHIAIVALLNGETSVPGILDRIKNLQDYKEEYRVLDTVKDGREMIRRSMDLVPGFQLFFSFAAQDDAYMWVHDITKFDAAVLHNPEKLRIWMAVQYYIKHASYPDFESIRKGVIQLVECQGYDWRDSDMLNMAAIRKMATEFGANYPIHFYMSRYYNTGMFENLVASALKKMVPAKIVQSLELGCQFELGRLDEIFLQPTPEIATQRLITCQQESLRRRYEKEASFSLEDPQYEQG